MWTQFLQETSVIDNSQTNYHKIRSAAFPYEEELADREIRQWRGSLRHFGARKIKTSNCHDQNQAVNDLPCQNYEKENISLTRLTETPNKFCQFCNFCIQFLYIIGYFTYIPGYLFTIMKLSFNAHFDTNSTRDKRRSIISSSSFYSLKSLARMVSTLLMFSLFICHATALPAVIRIGAIFTDEQRDSSTEIAFRYAVFQLNNDVTVLPNTTLVYDIQYTPSDDSFHATKKACKQISFGVQAMFGPFDPILGAHIQSITDALDIPHLESRLDLEPQEKEFSINLFPSYVYMNQAYKDMIKFLDWKNIAIIYEEDVGLMKLQDIIRAPPHKNVEVYIRQGDPDTYREILKEVKNKNIYSVIVDTIPEHMHLFLRCLLQLQMNDFRYHYLFTTFDIETFDLEDFKYNYVNMTAFRLVDSSSPQVKETLKGMENFQPVGQPILNKSSVIKAEPALVYDSVNVFAKGLHALERSAPLALANLSCENEIPWEYGSSLFNYINAVEYDGVTGPIKFVEGRRSNFKLDILKLRAQKLHKVGEWTPDMGTNITDRAAFFDGGKPNITLKVITVEEAPFVMVSKDKSLSGFCVDLLKRISEKVKFQYVIEVQKNGVYGVVDIETRQWNGLVRGLMDKKADLAVGSMTINYARESVIDFTKPFMNLGISILFKIPERIPTRLFSFMNPLAIEIWLYILAAYVIVSFTIFVVARFSPFEWQAPHPCVSKPEVLENEFTLANSFWFTIGTLMQQGSDLNPKAASTRIVGGIWWFFTLIIISSYTANLAAFLTVERMITPIENAEDLAEQSEIEYGTLDGGSTMAFFRDSKIETYKKMWRFMEGKKPSVFTSTIEDGVERVLKGNYAFLMESTMLEYTIERNCNLTQIGGLLNANSYGIATPMGSPWRDKISLAILELQEKGVIQMLHSKWWKNSGDVCNRDDKTKDSKANALGVENIGGVFVVLLCGLALAIVVAIMEFCWNSRKNSPTETQSLCLEMAEELKFALKCHGSKQRPAIKRACDRCKVPNSTHVPTTTDIIPNEEANDDSNNDSSLSTFEAQHNSTPGLTYQDGVGEVYLPPSSHSMTLCNVGGGTCDRVHTSNYNLYNRKTHQRLESLTSSPLSSPTIGHTWHRRSMSLKALNPQHQHLPSTQPNVIPASYHSTIAPPHRFNQQPLLHHHQMINNLPNNQNLNAPVRPENARTPTPIGLPNYLPLQYGFNPSVIALPSSPSLSSLPDPTS